MLVDLEPPPWATHLLSDLTDWQRGPLPVAEVAPFAIPDDAYFEYAWQDADGGRRPDPHNPNPRLNPWWDYASNLAGPAYRPDPDAEVGAARPQGRVLRLETESRHLGETRRLMVYSPPGLAGTPLPHVLFNDGKAYYGWGKASQVFDRLLGRGEVAPAHLVFVPPRQRTPEYAFNPVYRRFLVEEVLPAVEGRAPCDGRRMVWGASLGGLLGAMLAWEHRDLFQAVVAQSGAFLFSPDMDTINPFAGGESFLATVRGGDPTGLLWHLDCGGLEWLLASNERLAEALAGGGADVSFVVRSAGHNWVNWRNGLAGAFRRILPPGA
ncbi:MAG: esterase family protein [bacterium]|nr:esterase family protein [bacterium]